MYGLDSSSSHKKRRFRILPLLLIAALLMGLGYTGTIYGPALFYRVTGDAILKVESRIELLDRRIEDGKDGVEERFAIINEARKIVTHLEKNDPADPRVNFYSALLDLYELNLRLTLDNETLIAAAGRGYLPLQKRIPDIKAANIPNLALDCARKMRITRAIAPTFQKNGLVELGIIVGDLFYTGRTDPELLDLLDRLKNSPGSETLRGIEIWSSLAIHSITGESEKLNDELKRFGYVATTPVEDSKEPHEPALKLNSGEIALLRCFTLFRAKNYFNALKEARTVKSNLDYPVHLRQEATRLEAEIFYLQSSPGAALYFFREAQGMKPEPDPYLTRRIKEIESAISGTTRQ